MNYGRGPDAHEGLVVVERAWSVMNLWLAGVRNVVALAGVRISPHQARLLRLATQATLYLDGDHARREQQREVLPPRFTLASEPSTRPTGSTRLTSPRPTSASC